MRWSGWKEVLKEGEVDLDVLMNVVVGCGKV